MVIDTTLFIEYFRTKDKSKTTLAQLPPDSPAFISTISIFELFVGANTPERIEKTEQILSDVPAIDKLMRDGADKARKIASKTLHEVYEGLGFIPTA